MLIQSYLEHASEVFRDKKAVWYQDRWISFGELEEQANRVGQFLLDRGMQRGARVALLMENSFTFIAAYFGILKAGGVVVGLNTEITSEDLEYLVVNSDAEFLFINKERLRLYKPIREKLADLKAVVISGADATSSTAESLATSAGSAAETAGSPAQPGSPDGENPPVTYFDGILADYPDERPKPRSIDIDLAEIVYTSGSTGVPKGVMLTHLNLTSNMQSIVEYLHLSPEDSMIVVLPFTYIYGKSLLLTHILVGASLVIDNRFVYPNKVLETMKATGVTGFAGVPSSFSILLNRSSLRDYDLPKLRYVTQAGGHMAPALQLEVKKAFAPAVLYVMYGATEAAPRLSYLEPSMLDEKLGSIGTPVPNVDLFVADEEGNPLPIGEEGEIVARGSNIMQGYWKDPEGTAQVLKHGLYYTGDLAKQDEDGYFFIVGRKKDIIKVKGFRVSAKEIEEKILELEGVIETAVIGVDDPVLGEAVKAFIVPRDDAELSSQEVLAHLKPHLSTYKLPKHIEFRESLPKNKSGKIMKTELTAEEKKK